MCCKSYLFSINTIIEVSELTISPSPSIEKCEVSETLGNTSFPGRESFGASAAIPDIWSFLAKAPTCRSKKEDQLSFCVRIA